LLRAAANGERHDGLDLRYLPLGAAVWSENLSGSQGSTGWARSIYLLQRVDSSCSCLQLLLPYQLLSGVLWWRAVWKKGRAGRGCQMKTRSRCVGGSSSRSRFLLALSFFPHFHFCFSSRTPHRSVTANPTSIPLVFARLLLPFQVYFCHSGRVPLLCCCPVLCNTLGTGQVPLKDPLQTPAVVPATVGPPLLPLTPGSP